MLDKQLRDELELLHEELSREPELQEPTLSALKQVAEDINRLLESHERDRSAKAVEVQQQLQALQKFELQHPRLTRFVSQVTDLLGNMGF